MTKIFKSASYTILGVGFILSLAIHSFIPNHSTTVAVYSLCALLCIHWIKEEKK